MKSGILVLLSLVVDFALFAQVPTAGLIAHYPLDGSAIDLSTYHNNGTLIGGVTWGTDRFGNSKGAAVFNGSSGYVRVANSASLQSPSSALTISGWVYISGYSGTQVVGIAQKTESSSYGQYGMSIHQWDGSSIAANLSSGGGSFSAPFALNRWYFVAFTWGDNSISFYVNGVKLGTQSSSGSLTPDNKPLTLGLDSPGSSEYLSGKLDDIRIYNRSLADVEIGTLFNDSKLIAYYPLNGGGFDVSGNGNNGTIVGGVTWGSDRHGNPSGAAVFNGATGYIRVPNSTSLQSPSTAITIAGWVNISGYLGTQVAGIVQKTETSSYGQYGLSIHQWGTSGMAANLSSGGGSVNSAFDLNRWYFVAYSWDGATMKYYIDGLKIGTQAVSGDLVADTNPVVLGLDSPGSFEYLKGRLDDIRIYGRAFSDNEIAVLYSNDIGLVAHYPLDGSPSDCSGNGNNGSTIGGVSWSTDRFGNPNGAAQFNGSSGFIQVPNSTSLQSPRNSISISAWIYISGYQGTKVAGIVQKTNSSSYGQYGLSIHQWSGSGIAANLSSGGGSLATPFDTGKWVFVAYTWNGSSITYYLDGKAVGVESSSGTLIQDSNPLTLGLDSPGQSEYLQGRLDDIRIYNRCLSPAEVAAAYAFSDLIEDVEITDNSTLPVASEVMQNYPNPFNPSTTIAYRISERSLVKLSVLNSLGQEVQVLHMGAQVPGEYKYEFDGSHFASGVYFYRLSAMGVISTRRMVLLK